MKSKKNFNNNYKIKNLLNENEFDEMIMDSREKLWTRIPICKTLKVDDDMPNIKSISSMRVNINNLSYTIEQNITEKKVVVKGELLQEICYVSDTFSEKRHRITSNQTFIGYMASEESIDISKIKCNLCVYSQNTFVGVVNERTIITNTSICVFSTIEEENLPNKIIFKSNFNQKILEIDFNKNTQKLVVTFTGIEANISSLEEYFKFILRDRFGNEVINENINNENNAQSFSDKINNQEFEFNDSIELSQSQIGSIEILNYPNLGEIYLIKNIKEKFIITNKGLIEYLYPNKIIINNDDKKEVAKVEFNVQLGLVIVKSTGVQSTNKLQANEEYVYLILLNENLNIKNEGGIKGKRTASMFEKNLNNRKFNNGDIIKLRYKSGENIIITNCKCKRNYNPEERFEYFRINQNNLIPYQISFLSCFIRLRNKDNYSVIDILFSADKQIINVDSTGVKNMDCQYFLLKVMDWSQKKEKYLNTLYKGETGDKMIGVLDSKKFEYADIIELTYSDNTAVQIMNYPTSNSVYTPIIGSEKFIITPKGLVSFMLVSRIIIKNKNDEIVSTIFFNIKENFLKVEGTDNIANKSSGNNVYFTLEILDKNMIIKRLAIMKGKDNGKNFENKLNNRQFKDNDIIRLTFSNPNKIEITNYPTLENSIYIPKEEQESFTMDSYGLKHYPKTFKDIIYLMSNDDVIATISFDTDKNKLIASSTDKITSCPGFSPYATFEIFRGGVKMLSKSIGCNITSESFTKKVNGFCFEYNDEIIVQLISTNRVIVKNFETLGKDLEINNKRIIITNRGLKLK